MTQPASADIVAFCGRHGIRGPLHAGPAGAGRNSRVSRLANGDGAWILKQYGVADGRDRLGTEFAFLRYLNESGVAGVAQAIGMDRELHCALYSALPGARPRSITDEHIAQAAAFIVDANRDRATPAATSLPLAADACLSTADHLAIPSDRLGQLSEQAPQSALENEVQGFINDILSPRWTAMRELLAEPADGAPLQAGTRILSPSDFGFHNTLEHEGVLSFVDFEYAGWDDPVKLICDFICQPELPVTPAQGRHFIDHLTLGLPHIGTAADLGRRVARLLPVHRLKWCCILLNEFRPAQRQRRLHAGISADGLLPAQLLKARTYFNQHLASDDTRFI